MRAAATDPSSRRGRRACCLLLAAAFLLQQPLNTAVIVVDGSCGLADAITAANQDAPAGGCTAGMGEDEIRLTGDVTLIEPLPPVRGHLTLQGNLHGVTRHDAVESFRIFHILGPGPVVLRNITVSNGHASEGGGIYNDTMLSIINSSIVGNRADNDGGGIYSGWYGALDLIDSTIADNYATDGGGLYAAFGDFTSIESSTISGNVAGDDGGGVFNPGYSYLTVTNSTISGNTAGDKGGGLYNAYYAGDIELINSTVVGNTASAGGGFYTYPSFSAAGDTPEGHYAEIFAESSIIAANVGGNCAGDGQRDLGGNFDDDGSCVGASPIVADVDFDTALADNGGPTLTHALLAGSVAVDAGGDCGLAADQRGLARDALCDSGSYELGAEPFGLGGSVDGVRTVTVGCRNLTAGTGVRIDLDAADAWDCESGGFVAAPGDQIGQTLDGGAQGSVSGTMVGILATQVRCQNRTTGQQVTSPLDAALGWNCTTAGLEVSTGDRLRIQVIGQAP